MNTHKHAYIYEYEYRSKTSLLIEKEDYVLLTNVDGPKCKTNLNYLESAMRIGLGVYPKNVKFKYEKSI